MDIRQLEYFVEVVKSDFNLSLAAKRLYISQPALSQFIKAFEENENIYLFERYKGRLQGLTPTGEIFYDNAKAILNQYNMMLTSIREDSTQMKGKVRIGIPPLILGVVFADVIAQLVINNPNIEFEIIEKGAYELSKMFMVDELDFAILLDPTNINPEIIDQHLLKQDELTAFFNHNNPLATKEQLEWSDLNNQMMAILDPSFIIHHKLQKKFTEYSVKPKKCTMSSSWDFLMLIARNSDFITVLPSPVHDFHLDKNIIEKRFNDPIYWRVLLCRPKKPRYDRVHQYVFEYILDYFAKPKSVE
ncbi:LysR family transcriptional regulator [Zophobihabitans entericus]|uniref:LysR family transcriptional regulator n=1 Tax=Zophobihabitans entericus TaxID=1635327 RepID=A0A6G9ICU5_9GAMM|nr:LysR family transcriptional regulator [Zophobihabitans entericus]QIQ22043.1 LysR family transcriptional regulator [Zophobihabitans entericus]